MNARRKVLRKRLDTKVLYRDLRKLMPRANQFGEVSYCELIDDLNAFEISTRAHLRRLYLRHRKELRRIDREPFDPLNARIQRSELGDSRFDFLQRRRIFFNVAGLVRLALELEHGERWEEYKLRRYHQRDLSAGTRPHS